MSKYQTISKIDQLIAWGRYKEAVREAEQMLREYPEDADAYAMLSCAYLPVDEKKALYWSQEALRRDPEHEDAWRTRLFANRSIDDDNGFKETLDEILRLFPHKSYPYFYLAERRLKEQRFPEAREALEQAIGIYPTGLSYAMYGYVLALLNDRQASEGAVETALRMEPEQATVFAYAGWAADRRGDVRQAKEYMNAAVRLAPDDPQIRKEYLGLLQKQYWFYRVLLLPQSLKRLKAWQLLLIWFGLWILFKPLLFLFIVLYVAAHWISKFLVHIRVYGWTLPRKG